VGDNDWNEQFEELADSLGGLIGSGEIAAREFFGNDQFEHIQFMANEMNRLARMREKAQVSYLTSLSGLYSSLSVTLICAILFGLTWSLYYWITN